MKTTHFKKGFTLIEILVATAMIVSILSMMYGTYFTVSKSADSANSGMAMFQQGQSALDQITRQIRCSYFNLDNDETPVTKKVSQKTEIMQKDEFDYFQYSPANPNGEFLKFVTTSGIGSGKYLPNGLFTVGYKLDTSKNRLYFSLENFTGKNKQNEQKVWLPILDNIDFIELKFLDNGQWQSGWSSEERKKLPDAVKININLKNEIQQINNFATITYIACRQDSDQRNKTELMVNKK